LPALRVEEFVARNRTSGSRAFRGLSLTFTLSFVNLAGIIFTLSALGGLEPWSRWQFVGAFGVLEAGSGIANVISPNIWRLPIAEVQTSQRTDVELAASVLLIPHWAALARFGAGAVLMALAAWHEGVAPASLALVPFILAVAWLVLAASAAMARVALLRPKIDVAQINLRWGGRLWEFPPLSLSASLLQFLLSIATLPAAKLLPPSILYQPELAPSAEAMVVVLAACTISGVMVFYLWSGRLALRAPREQQREAGEHA
jgi:hypothetical protein